MYSREREKYYNNKGWRLKLIRNWRNENIDIEERI